MKGRILLHDNRENTRKRGIEISDLARENVLTDFKIPLLLSSASVLSLDRYIVRALLKKNRTSEKIAIAGEKRETFDKRYEHGTIPPVDFRAAQVTV